MMITYSDLIQFCIFTAATDVIEANWLTGATKFIMFGSAWSLNQKETEGSVILTAAYRDGGMSYHYTALADYIGITGAETVSAVFVTLKIPYFSSGDCITALTL